MTQLDNNNSVYIQKLTLSDHPYIKDACIDTQGERRHIIITGKNGVGKSTFLEEIKKRIEVKAKAAGVGSKFVRASRSKCAIEFNSDTGIALLDTNNAIKAFFAAKRDLKVDKVDTVTSASIEVQPLDSPLSQQFKQYLVNSRSQLAFAKDEGEQNEVDNLEHWFTKVDDFMSEIFEQPIKLKFDRRALDYKIENEHGEQLDFNHLSEGYSAIINIVTEIIMRMEAIEHGNFTLPGIVMIDEVETHLHVKLQKKVLSLLTKFFPNVQFIVTTHSPFVLTSIEDAVVYDMETDTTIGSKEELWQYSYEDIVEGYFDTETYSHTLANKVDRYEMLKGMDSDQLSVAENKELLLLASELRDVPTFKLADIELRLQDLGLK